jgi:copper chaperone NosL
MSRRLLLMTLTAGIGGLMLSGCGAGGGPDAPPSIRYGEDIDVSCGMIISEAAHAAAYRTIDGETRLFGDVGAMVKYHREQRESVANFFVHDYDTKNWLKADMAFYVVSPALRTPMDGGVVALADEVAARELARRVGGRTFGLKALLDQATLPQPQSQHQHP